MATLSITYFLRSEVLTLNKIRFSSQDVLTKESLRQTKESYPIRMAEYETALKNYDIKMKHYEEMLDLYRNNYEGYAKRLKDKYEPPQLPSKPHKPTSPKLSDQLAGINAEFRTQQFNYFNNSIALNWFCCCSSLTLVGGLLFLIMFEEGNQRIFYLFVLILSFVFMIGPSFHSIMSAIMGLLNAPPMF